MMNKNNPLILQMDLNFVEEFIPTVLSILQEKDQNCLNLKTIDIN